jgi:hypothetical protein
MSQCGQKFADWKFCLASKSLHPEQRRDAWIRRRAEWWARKRLGPSSENVWELRTCVFFSIASVPRICWLTGWAAKN